MEVNQTLHRIFKYLPFFKFIASAKFSDHILKYISNASDKMNRKMPAFIVFHQMLKEKIVKAVFEDVLNHIMTPVSRQEKAKGREIPVGQRLAINIFEN